MPADRPPRRRGRRRRARWRRRRPRPRCGGRGQRRPCCPPSTSVQRRRGVPSASNGRPDGRSGSSTSVTAGSNCGRAQLGRRTPLVDRLAVEAVRRRGCSAGRPPPSARAPPRSAPGGSSTGSAAARALAAARAPSAAPSRSDEPSGASRATPSAPSVAGDAVDAASAASPVHRADRPSWRTPPVPVVGAAVAGRLQPAGRVDERAHPLGPVAPAWRSRWPRRPPGPARAAPGPRAPASPGRRGASRAGGEGALDQAAQAVARRSRVAEPAAVRPSRCSRSRTVGGVLGHVLVDERVGEPGQRQLVRGRPAPRPRAAGASAARSPGPRTCVGASSQSSVAHAAHPHPDVAEPGRRRRMAGVADLAGLALAAVGRAPGDDLATTSMSIDRQNCGPIPVYVGLRSIRPSRPFLISQPISQPNWKLSRLSSIDQDRLMSMKMPSSVAAMISSRVCGPGSRPDVGHPHHRQPGPAVGAHAAAVVEAGRPRPSRARRARRPSVPSRTASRVRGRGALVVVAEAAQRARDGRVDGDVHQLASRSAASRAGPGRARRCRRRPPPSRGSGRARWRARPTRGSAAPSARRRGSASVSPAGHGGAVSSARASSAIRAACAARSSAVDQLPAAGAVLAAVGRVGAALRLAVADRGGRDAGAALADVLVDAVALAGDEPLARCPRSGRGPRPGRRRARASSPSPDQQVALVGQRHAERVDRALAEAQRRRSPARRAPGRRRARHHGALAAAISAARAPAPRAAASREVGYGEEAPARADQRPHADAGVSSWRQLLDLAVAGGHRLVAPVHHPGVGVAGTGVEGGLDRRVAASNSVMDRP